MKKFVVRLLCFLGFSFLMLLISLSFLVYRAIQPSFAEITPKTVLELKLEPSLKDAPSARTLPLQRPSVNSLRDIIDTLEAAGQDSRVKGLIVHLEHINFTGLAQIQELRNAIHAFRKTGKFAIAYNDTFGELSSGMGTYYLATSCDEIWMQPLGVLNIAGLASVQPFMRKLLDEVGILPEIETREEYKTAYDMVKEPAMTTANREATQSLLNSLFKQMIASIAKDRDLTEATIMEAVNHAPIFILQSALKEGLIDKIAPKDELYHHLAGKLGKDINLLDMEKYPLPSQRGAGEIKIAVVFANGLIMRNTQKSTPLLSPGMMDIEGISEALKEAMRDVTVKAVVLRIDSPGGSPLASEALWHVLKRVPEEGKKPLIISMADVAASGGYWIATPATKIVANPGTLTGSIGVIMGKFATEKLWEKIGVHWDTVETAPNATIGNMIYPYTPEEKKWATGMINYIYETFMQKVSEGRHLSMEHVHQIAKGRVWTGEQALQWGLVDVLGDLNTAIEMAGTEAKLSEAQKAAVQLVYLPKPKSLLERLASLLKGEISFGEAAVQVLSSLWPDFKEAIFAWGATQKTQMLTASIPKVKY